MSLKLAEIKQLIQARRAILQVYGQQVNLDFEHTDWRNIADRLPMTLQCEFLSVYDAYRHNLQDYCKLAEEAAEECPNT